MPSLRHLAVCALFILCLPFADARAQDNPRPSASNQPADVEALIRILEDDKARAALIERLKSAAPTPVPQKPAESAKTVGDGPTTAPDEASANAAAKSAEGTTEPTLARRAAEYTRAAAERAAALAAASWTVAGDLASIVTGSGGGEGFDWGRLIAVAATVGVTFAAFFALRALGIPFYRWIGRRAAGAGLGVRVALVIASVIVDALMIVIAWGAGYVFALQFGASGVMNIQQTLYLNAFFAIELAKVALRALFSPAQPPLRALSIEDEAAAYWYFWLSRIVSTLGYAFLFVAPIVAAAVSPGAAQALRIVVAFATLMMSIAIVLQNRARVRAKLAHKTEATHSDALSGFYAFLARFWHLAAIVWLVVVFVVWLANPTEALPFMARATAQTLAAMALGAVVTALISRLISGGLHVPENIRQRLPLLERRLNAFIPAILKVVRVAVLLFVLLVIAQSWALFDFLGWLGSEVGARVTTSVLTAGLIVVIGLVLFVAMSSWVEYRLNPEFGTVPTAREKTLLSLFRNAFTVGLVVLVAMMALAQLGVNIAPLLAGAGVLGLAIGFGAQSLVKDIITGLFIQLENAMNTGDNVTVAGVTGTVENLTIRSVGVRSVNGIYHLIPFSSVDSVSNATKVFSYHMAEIGVAYRESIPDVKQAMQDAFDRLRETEHGPSVVAPFEMQGITAFGDSAITVRGRIKTQPGKQWAVGRAYNEIVKEIFDERQIEMPFPHVTIYMGEDKQGKAPPLRVSGHGDAPLVAVADGRRALRPRARRESDRVETLDGPAHDGDDPG
ncbi:mechanosensitive ion channel [Chelatococcus sambhunathii]|uniref:Mechanosensitive ion channel n=1 Tax=Chelatococcus sambhunathii TaxID=363953 RepID=A0ABU1DCD5_9HYPH|nr:mechanosensitive ion channel domain-containing protein [Chelatococcus sambhunathii]MDR4305698.1 mechanosensitive ion channel [Chelatococcus sambhunathii]